MFLSVLYSFLVDLETDLKELAYSSFGDIQSLQIQEHLVGRGKAGIDVKRGL